MLGIALVGVAFLLVVQAVGAESDDKPRFTLMTTCVAYDTDGFQVAYIRPLNDMAWYPGDDYVDWWATDLFSVGQFWRDCNLAFIEEAKKRGRPVMIAESTPQYIGVTDGVKDWLSWFEPYFQFIKLHPNVKAFCYINWDWSKYEKWRDWGEARLSQGKAVLKLYRQEMRNERYLHASPELFKILGYAPAPPDEAAGQ